MCPAAGSTGLSRGFNPGNRPPRATHPEAEGGARSNVLTRRKRGPMVQLPHVPIAHLTFAPRSDPSAMDRLAGSPVLHSFIQTDFTWDPKSQHIGPVLWVRGLSPTGISNNTTTRGVQPVQRSNRGLSLTAKQTFGIPRRGVCPQPNQQGGWRRSEFARYHPQPNPSRIPQNKTKHRRMRS